MNKATIYSQAATEADDAFDRAIDTGRLSADRRDANYAGNYMFMGHGKTGDAFKHIETRQYLAPLGWDKATA